VFHVNQSPSPLGASPNTSRWYIASTGGRPPIDERFVAFHRANPQVYRRLRDLAMQAVTRRPGVRLSIAMLFEVLRYETLVVLRTDHFKLNNDFRSRYVRMLEEREPELAGRFETRRIRS
jgi:hypothetical protein